MKGKNKTSCNSCRTETRMCYTVPHDGSQREAEMDLHKEFLEFTKWALSSESSVESPASDPHKLLSNLGDEEYIYDLMSTVPDDQIGEVLSWAMNVDFPTYPEDV